MTTARTIATVFPAWAGLLDPEDPRHHEMSHLMFEPVVRVLADTAATVHVLAPGTALMDARGPCRYFGGEEAVLQRLDSALASRLGATGPFGRWGLGVADGRLAAIVAARRAARHGVPRAVLAGDSERFLAPVPVGVLADHADVPRETVEVLARLGLGTLGAVARLDERALIDRFGATGERLHLIVHGADAESLLPEVAARDLDRTLSCDDWPQGDSMSLSRLLAAAHDLCADLVDSLGGSNLQCVRLRVTVSRVGGFGGNAVSDRIWHEQHGFTVGAMLDRLRWQLSTPGERPGGEGGDDHGCAVSAVTFGAVGVQPLVAEHRQLWGGRHDHDARAARAVTMASALDGAATITVPEWSGGRDPATLYRFVDVGNVDLRDAESCRRRVMQGRGSARDWSGSLPRPLPATVHGTPRETTLTDGTGAPVRVDGRHELSGDPATVMIDGVRHRVEAWAGPWPVEERWWDPPRRRRLVRMQVRVGGTVHLLQLERSRWSIVARYD